MADDKTSYELVAAALTNAAENGYHMEGWSDDRIATDLQDFDSDLEDYSHSQILEYVKRWRLEHGG